MRNGQHWPKSGGSTICGNSGARVCVRSTTRIRPELRSAASEISEFAVMRAISSNAHFALESLRTLLPAGEPLLGHIAGIDVLDAILKRLDHRLCQRFGRELRRRQQLIPFIVDRPWKHIDDPYAAGPHLGAQALRQGERRRL